MRLTEVGRLLLLLGTALVVDGLFFMNSVVLAAALLLFVFLLLQGFSFQRTLTDLKIGVETLPSSIELRVGQECAIKLLVTNHSQRKIRVIEPRLSSASIRQGGLGGLMGISPGGMRSVEHRLSPESPGKIQITALRLTLLEDTRLFSQALEVPTEIEITAHPNPAIQSTIAMIAPYELVTDPTRRGAGTDLAGHRPLVYLDDFHRIDWKASARLGKTMVREYFRERDPAIYLLIDLSCSLWRREDNFTLGSVMSQISALLGSLPDSSQTGAVFCDSRQILSHVRPRAGFENRRHILAELLEHSGSQYVSQSYARTFPKAPSAGEKELDHLEEMDRYGIFEAFARTLLPYYRFAVRSRLSKLSQEGVFNAFEEISALPNVALVIAITDGRTNVNGLYYGASRAVARNHFALVVCVSSDSAKEKSEWTVRLTESLERSGVSTIACGPSEILDRVSKRILRITTFRHSAMAIPR